MEFPSQSYLRLVVSRAVRTHVSPLGCIVSLRDTSLFYKMPFAQSLSTLNLNSCLAEKSPKKFPFIKKIKKKCFQHNLQFIFLTKSPLLIFRELSQILFHIF